MMKHYITAVTPITLLCLLLIGIGCSNQGATELPGQQQANAATECNLKIEGMSCSVCAAQIKSGIKGLVLSSDIDVVAGTGKFTYAEDTTRCSELAGKISEIGFKATVEGSEKL